MNLSQKRIQHIVWNLLCMMPIMGMAIDLVAPSLPAISTSLHASSSMTKNVISTYLFGYALGSFFIGFLTDAWGRQKLLRVSLLGFAIVSLIPVFFHCITCLLVSRFLQGITMGAISIVGRVVFSDILPKEKLIRLGTMIGTMWGIGPVIGPIIGGYLQFYFNWEAGFCFFALITFISFVATCIIVPETHFNRTPLKLKTIKKNLIEVITHRTFIAMAILMGLTYALLLIFNIAGPFLIQVVFHHTPVFFGHLALWLGLIFLLATFVCRHFLKKYSVDHLLFVAISLSLSIALIALGLSYFLKSDIVLVMIESGFMFFACGFIFPMSMGKGISFFRHISGTATATLYLINISISSLTSFLVSFIAVRDASTMAWMYFFLLLISALVYGCMIRRGAQK